MKRKFIIFFFIITIIGFICDAFARSSSEIDLFTKGSQVEQEFKLYTDDFYRLSLEFIRNSRIGIHSDITKYIEGFGHDTGAVISLEVFLFKKTGKNESIIYSGRIDTQGVSATGSGYYERKIKVFKLDKGTYRLKVVNLSEHPQLKYAKVNLVLTYARTK